MTALILSDRAQRAWRGDGQGDGQTREHRRSSTYVGGQEFRVLRPKRDVGEHQRTRFPELGNRCSIP